MGDDIYEHMLIKQILYSARICWGKGLYLIALMQVKGYPFFKADVNEKRNNKPA